MCVIVCRQVVYVSIGSKKIVLLSVSVCRRVSAGCLCVDRFKKNWVVVCRCVSSCVSSGCLCVDRFKKNWIVVCQCVLSCVSAGCLWNSTTILFLHHHSSSFLFIPLFTENKRFLKNQISLLFFFSFFSFLSFYFALPLPSIIIINVGEGRG